MRLCVSCSQPGAHFKNQNYQVQNFRDLPVLALLHIDFDTHCRKHLQQRAMPASIHVSCSRAGCASRHISLSHTQITPHHQTNQGVTSDICTRCLMLPTPVRQSLVSNCVEALRSSVITQTNSVIVIVQFLQYC